MAADGIVGSKVKAYMESLSPQARAMLARSMQAAAAKGDGGGAPAVLRAALAELQPELAAAQAPGRTGAEADAWRSRFEAACIQPLEVIATAIPLATKQPGRVSREALRAIWTWIVRDVAARAYAEAAALYAAEPPVEPGVAARRFRKEATPLVLEALRGAEVDAKAWSRLMAHLGGETVARDLRDVVYALQRDSQFTALLAQLPRQIGPAEAVDGGLVALCRAAIDQNVIAAPFVASLVLSRAANPAALVVLALRLTGSNDPKAVSNGRFRELIDVALSEFELLAERASRLVGDRRERNDVLGLLKAFHDGLKQTRLSFEIETVPVWFKRIGGARRLMSELIANEIDTVPGLIRRALRVESLAGDFGGRFDADTFDDALFAVRLLVEARAASESLALNDLLTRLRRQVEQTVEVVSGKLMADLKSRHAFDRESLLAAVDGAIKLSALVFGEDYAALMRKSRDLAVQNPAGGRAAG